MSQAVTAEQVAAFVKAAETQMLALHRASFPDWTLAEPVLAFNLGQRYARVIRKDSTASAGGSAYCFIDLTNGDVLKAASWKAPAKGARGNLADAHGGLKAVGQYGAIYLR
jgi:hypothetical protein